MFSLSLGPTSRHQNGAPLTSHLPERQTRGLDEAVGLQGPRKARYSRWFNTGRWWRRCPEQIAVWLETVPAAGATILGIATLNREPVGRTTLLNRWKPHQYLQSTRAFYWDLNDAEHVRALFQTMRHLGAMQAGIEARLPRHGLQGHERRELCRSPMPHLWTRLGDIVNGHEIVELIEKTHEGRTPERLYRVYREQHTNGGLKTFFNEATEISIAPKAIEPLLGAIRSLLWGLRHRLKGRPQDEEAQTRGRSPRTWIARPHALLDRLASHYHWLDFIQEPYLWDINVHKACRRLRPNAPTRARWWDPKEPVSLAGYSARYLNRALACHAGQLRWDPYWGSQYRAEEDAARAVMEGWQQTIVLLMNLALVLVLLRRTRQPKKPAESFLRPRRLTHVGQCIRINSRARGPPRIAHAHMPCKSRVCGMDRSVLRYIFTRSAASPAIRSTIYADADHAGRPDDVALFCRQRLDLRFLFR